MKKEIIKEFEKWSETQKSYTKHDVFLAGYELTQQQISELKEQCEQITDDFSIKFAEWLGSNYVKLHSVWVGIYQSQTNKENWKKTTELQQYFKENVYNK
jgi:sugar phosphate isomerase/epimerase